MGNFLFLPQAPLGAEARNPKPTEEEDAFRAAAVETGALAEILHPLASENVYIYVISMTIKKICHPRYTYVADIYLYNIYVCIS